MSRSGDFRGDNRQTDEQTNRSLYPSACAWGDENKPSPLTKEHICTLIKQVALFPKSLNFDYRQLFYDENGGKCNLTKYMNDELMGCVDNISKSDQEVASRKVSELYAYSRKMKCIMVRLILANMMDPSVTFVQNLIGLACYVQGLCDKGMKLLNTFGVTANIFHIR